jgi:hypothetical protein
LNIGSVESRRKPAATRKRQIKRGGSASDPAPRIGVQHH